MGWVSGATGKRPAATSGPAEAGAHDCKEKLHGVCCQARQLQNYTIIMVRPGGLSKSSCGEGRRVGRVAEGGGLLNRCRTKSSTGGSNPPLSASKTKHFRVCNLATSNKPDLAAKSGFRLSPENLCRERREAKHTPVYPSGERSPNAAFLKCSTGISIQDR